MDDVNNRWIDRFVIDDGDHRLDIVIDGDASAAAGVARYRATCSCGRLPNLPTETREQALAVHMAHVQTKRGPAKGPSWLPEGARIVLLFAVMLIVWGACYATGQVVVHEQQLTGAAAKLTLGGFTVGGCALDGLLMVATRRYIAPTRV